MRIIRTVELHDVSKEEKLPGFTPEFPYIASRVELDYFREHFVPWHWHRTVELFYMESGELSYHTSNDERTFPAGSGGMINSNVIHTTRFRTQNERNIQILHLFDPVLLSGSPGSRIDQRYISPLASSSQVEIIALYPDCPEHADILRLIRQSFQLSEKDWGYELHMREILSQIWLKLLKLSEPRIQEIQTVNPAMDKVKSMLIYIHEHYADKISVSELASSAFLSERECYRVFSSCLHTTPGDYIRDYRLRIACRMLADGQDSVTDIGHACGLGNGSYFGKTFHEHIGCTPLEYRRKWQNRDIK